MAKADAAVPGASRIFFGDVEVDVAAMNLRRSGEPIAIEPQVFDVLRYLIENRDRVVTKEELLDQVWGDRFVSNSAMTSRIQSARAAVGDDGRRQSVIRTVHGRGYQFVAPLTTAPAAPARPATPPPPSRRHRPSAGVVARPAKELVDRVDIVANVCSLVAPGRLVTLVGPAGVGKTIVAQHVAASLAGTFDHGGWCVSLAEVRHEGGVGQAVLDAIGATRFPDSDVDHSLLSILSSTSGLLLLDNCEHVLSEVSNLVNRLLSSGAPIALMATSRQRLAIPGENVVDVPVLELADGVMLFTRRAAEQGVPLDDEPEVIATLCQALDRLPLALELACAQARSLGIGQLANLLDHRFELLAPASGDADSVTLDGAIGASYDNLSRELQITLGRFSQFAGWFDLPAATAIASGELELSEIGAVQHVVALAERSLIEVDTAQSDTRYRLLESIRLFADDRLDNRHGVQRIHVRYFADRAADQGHRLIGSDVEAAWHEMRADWTNYRAAIAYAVDLDMVDEAVKILNATVDHAEIALTLEHGGWADAVLTRAAQLGVDGPAVREARAGYARILMFERRFAEQAALMSTAADPADSYSTALANFWRAGAFGDLDTLERQFRLLEDHVRGTGGIRELTVGAIAHLASHNPAIDPTEASARALHAAQSCGELGEAFALVIQASLALGEQRIDDALALSEVCIDASARCGLSVLTSQAHSLRVRAVQSHPDVRLVGECVLDAMEYTRARGNWASARNFAPVAARVIAEAGLHEAAADVLDGFRPILYRSVSDEFLSELRRLIAPSVGAGLEGIVRSGADADPERYCAFVIDQLNQALSQLDDGD